MMQGFETVLGTHCKKHHYEKTWRKKPTGNYASTVSNVSKWSFSILYLLYKKKKKKAWKNFLIFSLKISATFYIFCICAFNHCKIFWESYSYSYLKRCWEPPNFLRFTQLSPFFFLTVTSTKISWRINLAHFQRCISHIKCYFLKGLFLKFLKCH